MAASQLPPLALHGRSTCVAACAAQQGQYRVSSCVPLESGTQQGSTSRVGGILLALSPSVCTACSLAMRHTLCTWQGLVCPHLNGVVNHWHALPLYALTGPLPCVSSVYTYNVYGGVSAAQCCTHTIQSYTPMPWWWLRSGRLLWSQRHCVSVGSPAVLQDPITMECRE